MKTIFFAPHWGYEDMSFEAFVEQTLNDGYDGIELSFHLQNLDSQTVDDAHKKVELINQSGLLLIAQHYETITTDFEQYKQDFAERLEILCQLNPMFINSQTGRDFFGFEQSLELIDLASEISEKHTTDILHETHRGRFSFASHVCQQFVNARPNIKLTADFSHWCCVAGTLLQDQQPLMAQMMPNMRHIHTRVGFSEGPQVSDPSATEFENILNQHLSWWKMIKKAAELRGDKQMTLMTEFGPPPYMPTLPHSQTPTCDQREANLFMKKLIKASL